MTFLQMQTLSSTWLSDPNNGYFSLTTVKLWLNNAQREAQKLVEQAFEGHFEKCAETTLVANQREYQLPDDFKRVVRLEVVLSGTTFQTEQTQRLSKITPNQQDRLERVGTPAAYYFKNNQLILVPAPDTAKTLRLTYTYRLSNMVNDNDESEIPEDYHELIPILATIDGLIQDGRDIGPMMAKKQHYEEMLKRDAEQRFIDAPRTVVQTEFDDYYEDL
jgi:hypothetical protein